MCDYLTGLYNRTSFNKKYIEAVNELPYGTEITVVLSDLDGLKGINDNYGHFSGDNAIRIVAQTLKEACPPDAICVRYGGDEMIGFIAGRCDTDEITARIRSAIDEHNRHSKTDYKISASVGVVTDMLSDETDIEDLIRRADKLMYIEKRSKKLLNA
ncbi:MAG: GGDEF domain-containing protein [Ruminococcus sp.]|nr:GGDEF domain-containing protein [Ruminococcus sp.]